MPGSVSWTTQRMLSNYTIIAPISKSQASISRLQNNTWHQRDPCLRQSLNRSSSPSCVRMKNLQACGIDNASKVERIPWINTQDIFRDYKDKGQGCGLKKLMKLFYGNEIHTGIDNPLEDAAWTALLLKDHFIDEPFGYQEVIGRIDEDIEGRQVSLNK